MSTPLGVWCLVTRGSVLQEDWHRTFLLQREAVSRGVLLLPVVVVVYIHLLRVSYADCFGLRKGT